MTLWPTLRRTAALVSFFVTVLALLGVTPLLDGGRATPHVAKTPGAGSGRHAVVALGDSVPSGAACSCAPFPELYGSLLSRRTGASVTVANDAVSGEDTAGLLAQLGQASVAADVRGADVVLVTIGANDFGDHHDDVVQGSCSTAATSDCLGDELASLRSRLAAVLSEVRALRGARPTTVLVTGYWNVFEDGQVAQDAAGSGGLQASLDLTHTVNSVIRSVATAVRTRYVDLFRPFQHPGRDIDSLLAADGDHPDAAGHRLIARTLLAAGLPRTT